MSYYRAFESQDTRLLLPTADASGVCGAVNALVFANKGDHHENSRNFAR